MTRSSFSPVTPAVWPGAPRAEQPALLSDPSCEMLGALGFPSRPDKRNASPKPEPKAVAGPAAAAALKMVGVACLAIGAAGVVLPVLPTTPFLLAACWAFMRSSPELAARVARHPRFGPLIQDWRDRGAIPGRAKAYACMVLGVSWIAAMATVRPDWLAGLLGLFLLGVAGWIVARPQ